MNYFEVKERLENLTEFHRSYRDYLDFTNRSTNVPAQMIRKRMQPLTPLTVESLNRVGMGSMITRDAPAKGGGKVKINLIRAIFRDHIIQAFSLDEKEPLKVLEQGILKYKKRLWRERLQLVNPIFWLFHFGIFLARLPFLIGKASGMDIPEIDNTPIFKFYLILFQIVYFYLIAESIGFVDWLG